MRHHSKYFIRINSYIQISFIGIMVFILERILRFRVVTLITLIEYTKELWYIKHIFQKVELIFEPALTVFQRFPV